MARSSRLESAAEDIRRTSVNSAGGAPRPRALSSTGHSLYELLGIPKSSDANEIKGAYRKFKEISRAYAILSDPSKRRIYDSLGSLGLQASEAFGNSALFDFFLTNKVFRAIFYCIALATCGFCCCCCCFCCYFCCGRFKPPDDTLYEEYPPPAPDEPCQLSGSRIGVAVNSVDERNASYEFTSCSREMPEIDVNHEKKLLSDQMSAEYGSIKK
ncbi:hypothetical protein M513_12070 [Trichuris suis]|uniref:J domain-containing protein n=1 Tax=Trichuris suis TaxID=68888 RepID=A0A085LQ36_9BILA|nr:hypothetical protein M513_12070 [Trichuris suis]